MSEEYIKIVEGALDPEARAFFKKIKTCKAGEVDEIVKAEAYRRIAASQDMGLEEVKEKIDRAIRLVEGFKTMLGVMMIIGEKINREKRGDR